MPEEQIDEQQEAPILDEVDTQEESESAVSEAEISELREKAAKADEYKGYAARVAAENKRLKRAQSQTETTETKEFNGSTSVDSDERYERLELKTDGYSSEEVDAIMELGGRVALGNPIVKEGIEQARRKARSKEATPSGTGKSPMFKGISDKDLKTMPLAEFEKLVSPE